jgi:hypothetical protein
LHTAPGSSAGLVIRPGCLRFPPHPAISPPAIRGSIGVWEPNQNSKQSKFAGLREGNRRSTTLSPTGFCGSMKNRRRMLKSELARRFLRPPGFVGKEPVGRAHPVRKIPVACPPLPALTWQATTSSRSAQAARPHPRVRGAAPVRPGHGNRNCRRARDPVRAT